MTLNDSVRTYEPLMFDGIAIDAAGKTIHAGVDDPELLIDARPTGIDDLTGFSFTWSLETQLGSGREYLSSPNACSTRLVNLTPNGQYVVQCDIKSGDNRSRKLVYTVLVDD